jgi:hypothetical protein
VEEMQRKQSRVIFSQYTNVAVAIKYTANNVVAIVAQDAVHLNQGKSEKFMLDNIKIRKNHFSVQQMRKLVVQRPRL